MTAIEKLTEDLMMNACPADQGMETERSLECRYDDRSKEELRREGICEQCWCESTVKKIEQ